MWDNKKAFEAWNSKNWPSAPGFHYDELKSAFQAGVDFDTKRKSSALWNEDETWTIEAQHLDQKFGRIVKAFIEEHDEHKVRELEILMHGTIVSAVLESVIRRRL